MDKQRKWYIHIHYRCDNHNPPIKYKILNGGPNELAECDQCKTKNLPVSKMNILT